MRTDPPGYRAIRAAAVRLGWPTAFRRDLLKHDRRAVRRKPETPFVWMVRECGTDLVFADDRWPAYVVRCHARYYANFFAWDGGSLEEITADGADAFFDAVRRRQLDLT